MEPNKSFLLEIDKSDSGMSCVTKSDRKLDPYSRWNIWKKFMKTNIMKFLLKMICLVCANVRAIVVPAMSDSAGDSFSEIGSSASPGADFGLVSNLVRTFLPV